MIQEFADAFIQKSPELREKFRKEFPGSYVDIVCSVVELLKGVETGTYVSMDPDRIIEIDHGDYQGTRLYVIGAEGYQPSTYWSVYVNYGSCGGCDSLKSIRDYSLEYNFEQGRDVPNETALDDVMSLALHIVQSIKEI